MKIKLALFSSSRAKEYVCVRLGDVSEYERFSHPHSPPYVAAEYKAGKYVGSSLTSAIKSTDIISFNYKTGGVEIPPYFTGLNYVSLYWGDEDCQWIRDFTDLQKDLFERGVREEIRTKKGRLERGRGTPEENLKNEGLEDIDKRVNNLINDISRRYNISRKDTVEIVAGYILVKYELENKVDRIIRRLDHLPML